MASDFEYPVIDARSLDFAYGQRQILQGIDLTVESGEVIGLLGPNGSGKSTLLRILAGLQAGYSGSVTINGRPINTIPGRERACHIAVVPQESRFSFPFSVLEIVMMGRYPYLEGFAFESATDIRIAEQVLARCGARHLARRTIHELSSGERQRVVFARALAQQPRILLLDEPATFLDIHHQIALYDIVHELARDADCAVLTVLHDLNLAAEYCDRVYLLSGGQIRAGGKIPDVLTCNNIESVFNTEVRIMQNELTGKPLIFPVSKKSGTI